MTRLFFVLLMVSAVAFYGVLLYGAVATDEEPAQVGPSYLGVKKCKTCHLSDAKGAQYKIWAAGPHAAAYTALGTPQAIEVARKAGVEGNPQESTECLECHTTGARAPAELRSAVTLEEGVSCEMCHGPGGDYGSMKVMKAVFAGETHPDSVGLIFPGEETCRSCHNERSPTFVPFDFAERSVKIAHPYPEGFRAARGGRE